MFRRNLSFIPAVCRLHNVNAYTAQPLKYSVFLRYILEKSQDALRYLERNGLSATIHKIENKLGGKSETSYDAWCQKYDVKKEELEEQRKKTFSYQPLFSVVVPPYPAKTG